MINPTAALLLGSTAHLYGGAGVVRGSIAAAEWDEVHFKMRPFLSLFPAPSSLVRRALLRYAKWGCFGFAWACYGLVLATLFDSFHTVVQPWRELPNGALWGEIFDVALWVNVGIVVTYSAFPLIHLYQVDPLNVFGRTTNQAKVAAYKRAETAYVWASLIAKSALVLTIGVAAFMRRD